MPGDDNAGEITYSFSGKIVNVLNAQGLVKLFFIYWETGGHSQLTSGQMGAWLSVWTGTCFGLKLQPNSLRFPNCEWIFKWLSKDGAFKLVLQKTGNITFTVTLVLATLPSTTSVINNSLALFPPSPICWHKPVLMVHSACQTVNANGRNAKWGKDHMQSDKFVIYMFC